MFLATPNETSSLNMSDGASILLRRYGRPNSIRLILSHGNGLAIDAYFPFWKLLIDEFDVFLFDIRNHGQNPQHQPAFHNWDRIAQDIMEISREIRAQFGNAPTVGIFHSLSAVAALRSMRSFGPHYDALMLCDPPLCPDTSHYLYDEQIARMKEMAHRASSRQIYFDSPEQFANQLACRPAFKRWAPGAHLLFAQATLKRSGDMRWALRCTRENEAHIFSTNVDATLWQELKRCRIPTIILGADPTLSTTDPTARICWAIHQEIGTEYTYIPETTHFLQIEKPLDCYRVLLSFIERHDF